MAARTVTQLPGGALYQVIETFPNLAGVETATGPPQFTIEDANQAWLLRFRQKGAEPRGGTQAATIGSCQLSAHTDTC
jgi:hypothetical protein